jgi:LmbE family N-acetylglucosaminyl deacetylase
VHVRLNAGLRDAYIANDEPSRARVAELVRRTRPRVVILPFPIGRHPDHRVAAELGRDACYLAGLAKYTVSGDAPPHRPFKILYALAYREDPVKPSFVVDVSDCFEVKMQAIRCYASQFEGAQAAGEIFPTGRDLYELIRIQSAHYGSLIRRPHGEPFFCHETLEIEDVLRLGVASL